MKQKYLVGFIFLLSSHIALGEDFIILNKTKYALTPKPKMACSSYTEYVINSEMLHAGLRVAEKTNDQEMVKNFLFGFIREYPSRFSSPNCKKLRQECESVCISKSLGDRDTCFIECNQYETWNR